MIFDPQTKSGVQNGFKFEFFMEKLLYLSIKVFKAHSFGGFIILFAVAALLSAPAYGAVKRYVTPTPEQIETELLEMINREREMFGRKPLVHHLFLQEIARSHSAKMAAEGKLSHDFPGWPGPEQRMQQGNFCFLVSAENISHGQTPVARFIHEALMASLRHKINILDDRLLQAGIGVCKSGNDYYVSEEFAAIIECPIPEKVMVFSENDICRWYKNKFNVSPAILSEARVLAKVSAQQDLIGIPIEIKPFNGYRMQGINICYNDLGVILTELKKEIISNRIISLAIGVVWGRKTGFPGGTYSVSLLLFEEAN